MTRLLACLAAIAFVGACGTDAESGPTRCEIGATKCARCEGFFCSNPILLYTCESEPDDPYWGVAWDATFCDSDGNCPSGSVCKDGFFKTRVCACP